MINATMARSYAFKSVGVTCHADAMKSLYDAIDRMIEKEAKEGKMSATIFIKDMVSDFMKVELSHDQLKTLSEEIKQKYKGHGFNVDISSYSYSRDDLMIDIGWFSL